MDLEQPLPSFSALPNEILLQVLQGIGTTYLLPVAGVSHRFSSLVLRILHQRLTLSASSADGSLVFECYTPSRKRFEPHMLAGYNGTPRLETLLSYSEGEDERTPAELFRELNALYSSFTPYRPVREKIFPWKHPAGDVPGSRTWADSTNDTTTTAVGAPSPPSTPNESTASSSPDPSSHPRAHPAPNPQAQASRPPNAPPAPAIPARDPVKTQIHLDAGDLFSQLCADTSVSILGPKPGLFLGMAPVNRNGILRVWRQWLCERAAADGAGSRENGGDHPAVLWVNNGRTVGVRFAVREREWDRQPVLQHRDDESAVSYEVEYQEILVRSRDLLLASEKLQEQRWCESGRAVVIGTWV